ncbi:MAG: sigma-70 family RNA polymerase sigma factor [Verrucomicrobiales bacterium]|nr:sigma-70 family RNA polymerase sigma factor [Verrucomicrobiales bacterium]
MGDENSEENSEHELEGRSGHESEKDANDKPGGFPETTWAWVENSKDPKSDVRRKALESLFNTYWPPLYGYARKLGNSELESEELLQGFFHKLIEKRNLEKAERLKGKFRNFLLKNFDNFIKSEWKKEHAEKRGGFAEFLSIDKDEAEKYVELADSQNLSPEEFYEQIWARTLLEYSLVRLKSKYKKAGKMKEFKALLPFLTTSNPDYQDLAKKLGCSVESARVYKQRFKGAYQDAIKKEIAETIEPGGDVERELMNLLTAFSRRRGDK